LTNEIEDQKNHHYVFMKNYFYGFSLFFLLAGGIVLSTGCAEDPAKIPAFIRIDTIIVDSTCYDSTGSISSKIDFAWVYINDNFQGAYQLPAKFPVIGEGVKNIKIFAGVYEFGNGTTATRYIFYDEWETTDTLVVEDTLFLSPHVHYNRDPISLKIPSIQDFDMKGSDFQLASGSQGNYNPSQTVGAFEGGICGNIHLSNGDTASCTLESATAITVPKGLPGYFLELNYRCNSPFTFGIKTSTGSRSIIGFNTKDTWNKAYINITYAIDVTPGTDVKMVFTMPRDLTLADQDVYLDNIKLIFKQ
jgi:hypothetical protein